MLSIQGRSTTFQVDYGFGASPTSFTAVNPTINGTPSATAAFTLDQATFGSTIVGVSFGDVLDNQSGVVTIRIVTLGPTTGSGSRDTHGLDDFKLSYTYTAPTPVLATIDPSTTTAGSAAFTLTLNGSNFLSGAAAYFNGTALTTTFVSATELTATVPASAVTAAGSFPVTVKNASTGTASNTLDFVVTAASSNSVTTTAIAATTYCVGSTGAAVSVPFTSTGTFSGNTYTAYIGTTSIGTLVSNANSGTISAVIPTSVASGTTYRVRVDASNPATTGTDNGANLTVVNYQTNNVSSLAATAGNMQATLTWTNPTACFSQTVVVASTSSITATPAGSFTANTAYGSGTDLGGGQFVVYAGTGATVAVTALTNGTTYFFKAFTTNGDGYSSGVQTSATPLMPPPAPTTFTPGAGPIGTVVTISGTNLSSITGVTFGGVAATGVVATVTEVTATVALGSVTGPVVLTDGTATYTVMGNFTVTTAPVVTTAAATAIAATTATVGGSVSSSGGATITTRGVVYSTTPNPRINGAGVTPVMVSGTTGSFTTNLTGLSATTTYYVAAYATNNVGTTYGADESFTTLVAPLLAYTFDAPTNPENPSTVGANISASTFKRSAGLTATSSGDFRSSNFPITATLSDTTKGYYEFRIKAASGYQVVLTSLTLQDRASSTGPQKWELRTSLNNFNATVDAVQNTGSAYGAAKAVSLNSLGAFTGTVVFRIYGYSTTGAAGTFGVDNVNVYGTTMVLSNVISAPTFTGTAFCADATFNATFTPTSSFAATNSFVAQLSDNTGSFGTPTEVGRLNSTTTSEQTIAVTLPAGTTNGSGYLLRIVSTDPAITGASSVAFTVVNAPTVTIAPPQSQTLATNTDGTVLTATETPAAVTRQWYYSSVSNGPTTAIAGATGTSYTPNFATAGSYYVTVVSTFAACGSVTSNEVLITITAPVAVLTATPNALTLDASVNQSATRTYLLEGFNLAANATVTISSDNAAVMVSTDGGTTYLSATTVTATGNGTLNQTVRVRFTAPATAGTTTAIISNTSGSASAAVAVTGNATAQLAGTPFTAGNLALVRVGDGVTALTGAAAPVFIDEYTPAGALVRSIALPIAASGSNFALTANGSSSTNGLVTLSPNRQFISLAGFNAAPGTTNVASAANIERVVGLVDFSGVVNTSTLITDGYIGNDIRSAVTTDGTGFWTAGNGNSSTGGTRYVALGSTGASTQLSNAPTNTRVAAIYFNQLYSSAASGATTTGINTVGTGLPKASGQTTTLVPGLTPTDAYGFVFFDLVDAVAGPDVVYVIDGSSGIRKYSLVGSSWVQNGGPITGATVLRGLAGSRDASGIRLFATNASGLFTVLDDVAYNTAPATTTLMAVATAATNQAFRGVAFAPGSPVVLPVTLTSFTAERQLASVAIRWTTALEKNSAHFYVQRSLDGKNFSVVKVVAAQGQSSQQQRYLATDAQPARQLSYYRLRQVDQDGTTAYSPVIAVPAATEVQLYPNPVQHMLTVQLPQATEDRPVVVQLTDLAGRILYKAELPTNGQLDMRALRSGTYLLYVGQGANRITRKVVKQ